MSKRTFLTCAALLSCLGFRSTRSESLPTDGGSSEQQEDYVVRELATLDAEMKDLRAAYAERSDVARQQAVAAWMQQRAARFDALNPMLAALAERQEREVALVPIVPVEITANATPQKQQLLQELNQLNAALGQVREQRGERPREQVQRLLAQWMNTHSDWLDTHLQLVKEVSAHEAAMVEPGEIVIEIPSNASPEMRSFLFEHAAILDEMANLQERYRDATDVQRQRAVAQWLEVHAARLAAHCAQGKRLSAN